MADQEVKVVLKVDDQMSQQIADAGKKVDKSLSDNKESVKSLGDEMRGNFVNAIKGAVLAYAGFEGVKKVTQFFMEARKEAQESIRINLQLKTALGYVSSALDDQAQSLAKKLTVDDDDIKLVQLRLANYVKEESQIRLLTPAILDLAAATGMDMASAANIVAKAISDDGAELGKFKIAITGAQGSAERITSVVSGLNAKFGDQAVEAAKAKDWIDALSISWKQFQENTGKALRAPTADDEIERMRKILTQSTEVSMMSAETKKEWTDKVNAYDKKQNDAKLKQQKDQEIATQKAINDETLRLKTELWKTEENGQTKILAIQMFNELDAFKGTQEQRLLITKRYENLISQAKAKSSFTEIGADATGQVAAFKAQKAEQKKAEEAEYDAKAQRFTGEMNAKNQLNEMNLQLAKKDEQKAIADKDRAKASVQMSLGAMASIFAGQKQYIALYKTFAISQAIMDTYAAANTNLKTVPMPWGGIAAGVAVAVGLANVAKISAQKYATGTAYAPGGMALVGENGPEYVNLPRGAQVYNNSQTRNMTTNASMNVTIMDSSGNITETIRAQLRSGSGDQLIRDISNRMNRQL